MSNYTEEMTAAMIREYTSNPSAETVEMLAEMFGKSKKSIIGKLSREGVYRREVYVSKTGESPITKVEIVNNIAEMLGIGSETVAGLEKSPKAALKNLEKAVAGSQQPLQITVGTLPVSKWDVKADPAWDLDNDPEYEPNVPRVKL